MDSNRIIVNEFIGILSVVVGGMTLIIYADVYGAKAKPRSIIFSCISSALFLITSTLILLEFDDAIMSAITSIAIFLLWFIMGKTGRKVWIEILLLDLVSHEYKIVNALATDAITVPEKAAKAFLNKTETISVLKGFNLKPIEDPQTDTITYKITDNCTIIFSKHGTAYLTAILGSLIADDFKPMLLKLDKKKCFVKIDDATEIDKTDKDAITRDFTDKIRIKLDETLAVYMKKDIV